MRELKTVQTQEKLNKVFAADEKGNGGANHSYKVQWDPDNNGYVATQGIQFQNGARREKGSVHGVIDGDLLEIVRDRITAFQNGPFSSNENKEVLFHIEQALKWMNKRVEDRIERNVLGRNKK